MTWFSNIYRRFIASTRGVAAIEFAFILPVMLVLLLASFDASRAIAIYMKVRAANSALATISNQFTTIHDADKTEILGATSSVLAPYSSSPIVAAMSELQLTGSGQAKVIWSDALNGTPLTVGSTVSIPTAFTNSYLVLCSVSYTYTPFFTFFISHPITLSDSLYTIPRTGASITRTSP